MDINALRNQRWLREEDITTLTIRLLDGTTAPSHRGLNPVDWLELAKIIGSYNAWTRVWNVHETDRSLSLSPDWWDGESATDGRRNMIIIWKDGRTLHLRTSGTWRPFHLGWSMQRHEIPLAAVMWAGWERSNATRT